MARKTKIDDLMFPVELRPVYTNIELGGKTSQIKVPNSRVVVNKQSGKALGVVSTNYKLITNQEAIEMGKKCCTELFGADERSNIEIFKAYAPSTGSYCHIDLVHKNYVMNLWNEKEPSNLYIPYVRVTNSYNTSRALRFDVGFCRKICLNGVIFEAETIKFTFSHIKHVFNQDITFAVENGRMKKLFEEFSSYAKRLKSYEISRDNASKMIIALFKIKEESEIDFRKKNENLGDYEALLKHIKRKLNQYTEEIGENGYSLFNTITDIASHPIDNRYFRRDTNSLQRLAGNWINSFQNEINGSGFNILEYIEALRNSEGKTRH
jgi:hypothetical protein